MPMKAAITHRNKSNPALPQQKNRRGVLILILGWMLSSFLVVGVEQIRLTAHYEHVFRYQEGDLIRDAFIVPNDFSFLDKDATEKLKALNRSMANPVYIVQEEITASALNRCNRFIAYVNAALSDRDSAEALQNIQREFPGTTGLLEQVRPLGIDHVAELLERTRNTLEDIQYAGIFRIEDAGSASGIVEVVYSENLPGRRVTLIRDSLVQVQDITTHVKNLSELRYLSAEKRKFIIALTVYLAETNAFLSRTLTKENIVRAEESTIPVYITVNAGTLLLDPGGIVTGRQARILEGMREQLNFGWRNILDPFLYLGFIFALGYIFSRYFTISFSNAKTMWFYLVLSGTYLLIASILNAIISLPEFLNIGVLLPTALFSLLFAQILQNRRMAILSSILMALLVFFLSSGDSHVFLVTLILGIGGTLSVGHRDIRIGLLRVGPRLALVMLIATFLTGILADFSMRNALLMSVIAMGNGIATGILSLAFLPLLEHFLNTPTSFRLNELSDQNSPILKRMRLQAPGTYIHSQNVANLAEAACDAIDADGLLARVGGYYHDIGKIDQAHFFVENQSGENKHDDMKTSLSVAVIKSHVKIGMEKGRRLRLPNEVLDFIEQHHGTSVIQYFYIRAIKESGGRTISPEDYSYSGPKPQNRETAIVMLADFAEAATRVLKKPTAAKLEKYIWDLIMERFKTGELNESNLTFSDLENVKKAFVHVLTGYFHSRIAYPKTSEESA